ncbi:MAG: hypothetical protein IAE78_16385 [Myxococcus sp.]|nr:hypothetical protein [Myxococcus sp.]
MTTATTVLATLPEELAQHWRNVLSDAGLGCELRAAGGALEVVVAEADADAARALFEAPFEDEAGAPVPADPGGPALGPDERTAPLVVTDHAVIADRLRATLHLAGLFAIVRSDLTSSVFGVEGMPQFTVIVAEAQRDEAVNVLSEWARTHANDFATESGVSRVELLDALAAFFKP